jgi:hypothetical protein
MKLAAQAPLRSQLNGYWWVEASEHDKIVYQMGFADGGGRIGSAAAIDRLNSNPAALDVPLKKAIHMILARGREIARVDFGASPEA